MKNIQNFPRKIFVCIKILYLLPVMLMAQNLPPIANITVTPSSGDTPLLVSFSSNASFDPDGFITGVIWDFNAQDTISIDSYWENTKYLYYKPGIYQAKLIVTDNCGALDTMVDTIIVSSSSYVTHDPIFLVGVQDTIIEGLEINNTTGVYHGDGIVLEDCDNITIRNCYVHDCTTGYDWARRAVYVVNSNDIVIENNIIENNEKGILFRGDSLYKPAKNCQISSNYIKGCKKDIGIRTIFADSVWIENNYLIDNGDSTFSDLHRIVGIRITYSNWVWIHNNWVINSTSDGIGIEGVGGDADFELDKPCHDIETTNNYLSCNKEQGVWMINVRDSKILNNFIHVAKSYTYSNGIFFEWNVHDIEVKNNVITGDRNILNNSGITANCSYGNLFKNNTISTTRECGFYFSADTSNIWFPNFWVETSGNEVVNNIVVNNESIGINFEPDAPDAASLFNNDVWHNGTDYSGTLEGTGDISLDPMFFNTVIGDLYLKATSPCIDAGYTLGIDIGALEWGDLLDTVFLVVLKEDSSYTSDLTHDLSIGDTLFIQLEAQDNSPTTFDWTSVTVNSSITDPEGIRVILFESGTNSGIYRKTAIIQTESNEDSCWIGANIDETIYITADWDTSKSDSVRVTESGLADSDSSLIPNTFKLFQNSPNPFFGSTYINYHLPKSTKVSLKIYNCAGQLIKTLVDEYQSPGIYSVPWDGKDDMGRAVASGVYFCQFKSDEWKDIKRFIKVRR